MFLIIEIKKIFNNLNLKKFELISELIFNYNLSHHSTCPIDSIGIPQTAFYSQITA